MGVQSKEDNQSFGVENPNQTVITVLYKGKEITSSTKNSKLTTLEVVFSQNKRGQSTILTLLRGL